jgi:hypothetical protein
MAEAQKYLAIDGTLTCEFHHMILCDYEHPDRADGRREIGTDDIATSGTGMIALYCGHGSRRSRVHVELWSAAPEHVPGYEDSFEGALETTQASLTLDGVTATPDQLRIELPTAGTYVVRAYRRGPVLVGGEVDETDRDPEEWLLQLWSSDSEHLSRTS